ncbi:MAG TPA: YbjN domain-containing protein [Xanthobacteraceae bacterium]|nr:YbjN domain-containing protein [Xanthobacteraceae bacterium]
MSVTDNPRAALDDPLAVVEHMAIGNEWDFSRAVDDEITLAIAGAQTNYQASFSWMEDIRVLHIACAFEMTVPSSRLAEVQHLISSINEQLWIGHFDVWDQNGLVMFRHALLLTGGVSTSARQCEAVLGAALDSCERYYPALQFVVWAGKSAREALDAAMFETAGEA